MRYYICSFLWLIFQVNISNAQTNIDGIYYNLISNTKEAEVTYRDGGYVRDYSGDIVIPEEVVFEGETYKVTAIGDKTFFNCKNITSVILPSSIKYIRDEAFRGCGLKSINIPSSVILIGRYSFGDCALTSLNIPDGLTSISTGAFSGCSFVSVTIPNSVKSICSSAFSGCENLEEINFGNNVSYIGSRAFSACRKLSDFEVPNSVLYLGAQVFNNCSNLKSLKIGNNVIFIGEELCRYCYDLESLTLPNSILTFEKNAFKDCSKLKTIISNIESPSIIDNNSSDDMTFSSYTFKHANLYVPYGTKSRYRSRHYGWWYFQNVIEQSSSSELAPTSGNSGDLNNDNIINAADVVKLTDIIMNQSNKE